MSRSHHEHALRQPNKWAIVSESHEIAIESWINWFAREPHISTRGALKPPEIIHAFRALAAERPSH